MIFETLINTENKVAACQNLLHAWETKNNKVFVLRTEQPIADVKTFYNDLFPYLGEPQALAEDATISARDLQRTHAIWMEVRYDPNIQNAYRHSAAAQPLHTDGSYIPHFPSTLMCCVANTGDGGETIFIDSQDLYSCLADENENLLAQLMTEKILHERSGDTRLEYPIRKQGNEILVNWNYYCVSPSLSARQETLVEKFQHYLLTSALIKQHIQAIKLQPGDAVVWKDDKVLHGRNAFSATQTSERFLWKCAIALKVDTSCR
jgi:alpha-ketoglutarate-dependent taurine dioxygenase